MVCGINLPGGKPCLENKWSCDRDGDRHLSSAPLVSNSFIAFHPFYKINPSLKMDLFYRKDEMQ